MDETSKREDADVMTQINLSLQSIGAIKMEEFSSTSSETQSAEKYDTLMSESNTLRQFKHVSWKYKNPYSVSINNPMHYEKSNHASSKHSLSLINTNITK